MVQIPSRIPTSSQLCHQNPSVEECLRTLDQICTEVTAALKVAAEVMKHSRITHATYEFKPGDLVWLEGTNVHNKV